MMDKLESYAALYSALAFSFAYPDRDADFALIVSEMGKAVALAEQAPPSGTMRVGPEASSLRASLDNLRAAIRNPQSTHLTPAEEHIFLFHRQALCSPYESTYSPAGMEQNLADIAGFYRAFGVQMSPDAHERVDHIGSELEFMAVLCAKEAHALRNGLTEQAQICRDARSAFLSDHLGLWALAFASRVHEKARLPLYPALTDMLASLLALEAEDLGVTLRVNSPQGVAEVVTGTTDGEELSCE
jgi:DMSO reductase family type II enzyme chaperone